MTYRRNAGRLLPAAALATVLVAAMCHAAAEGEDMLARYQRAERFGSPRMGRLVYKARVEPHWISGSDRFWYRNDVRGDREFILVDSDAGTRVPAFDHERLADALAKATGERMSAKRLPFQSIDFAADGGLLVRVAGVTWRCDLRTYECSKSEAKPEEKPAPEKRDEPKPEPEPGQSPDGRWIAFLRDHNLWLRAKDSGEESPVTTAGSAEAPFTVFHWSPASTHLVAYRTEPGDHLEMPVIRSSPPGSLRPKVETYAYDLPGDKLDAHEMWTVDAVAKRATQAQTDRIEWGGPPDPRWAADGRAFTFEQTDRGYARVRVIEVDVETGKARTIIDERSNTFVAPMKQFTHYLDASGEILWSSERDGWNHLYLYDARMGEVKCQVTKGEWVVRGVESVDEVAGTVTFRASGREPGEDPYLIDWYRVNLDGTGLVRLTEGNGDHEVRFSPSGGFLLDSYSRVDLAPVTDLRRTADGSLVCHLETADVSDLLAIGWRWPEPFAAKGRDGQTDIWGVIYRPSGLDESRKYPVLELIYAGPQDSFVPKTFAAARADNEYAELGLIVVQIDGMGTSNRSKAFHDVCYKDLGDGGFPDRILWMKAAAERYPYMDLTRVGITGHSAGGYNAARALLAFGDFYKVAVAGAGNHDHRTDKVWWNELWMGYPVGPHYAEQSNVTNAAKLTGKLLLIHGEVDHNVNPSASTMQFANALIQANKDFDMLILPGSDHGFPGTYAKRRTWDYFVTHLLGETPPKEYAFQGGADAGADVTVTIRNTLPVAVAIYWVNFEGRLQKYHDLAPGQEVQQHTYAGHEWEAEAEGATVSRYTASKAAPVWVITPNPGTAY